MNTMCCELSAFKLGFPNLIQYTVVRKQAIPPTRELYGDFSSTIHKKFASLTEMWTGK
jgi:hypothetical protein